MKYVMNFLELGRGMYVAPVRFSLGLEVKQASLQLTLGDGIVVGG